MITVEYRLPLPLSLAEYNRALRYVVARVAESTTGVQPGEGVQILVNEPFEPGAVPGMDGGGTHTVKLLRFRSRMPALLRRVTPSAVSEIHEESWFSDGEASRCKTVYRNPFLGDRFYLCIESNHVAGVCTEENAVGLGEDDLARRDVMVLDIAGNVPRKVACEDPSLFLSEKTGRGRLMPGWFKALLGMPVDGEKGVVVARDGDGAAETGDGVYAGDLCGDGVEGDGAAELNGDFEDAIGGGDENEEEDDEEDDEEDEEVVAKEQEDDGVSSGEFEDAVGECPADGDAAEADVAPASSAEAAPLTPAECMTCYKVVRMEFTGFGMRRFVQRWTTRAVVPNSLLDIHRKLFCWMDEWCDLTREQILQLEDETAETTRARLEKHDAEEAAGAAGGGAAAAACDEAAAVEVASGVFSYEYVDE